MGRKAGTICQVERKIPGSLGLVSLSGESKIVMTIFFQNCLLYVVLKKSISFDYPNSEKLARKLVS